MKTTVNIGFHLAERLQELAAVHGRDLTGEARAAVRSYLEAHGRLPTDGTAAGNGK